MAEAGWSNGALAKRLSVAENTVARWRNGWRRPRADEMVAISEISDGKVMPNDFFSRPRREPTRQPAEADA